MHSQAGEAFVNFLTLAFCCFMSHIMQTLLYSRKFEYKIMCRASLSSFIIGYESGFKYHNCSIYINMSAVLQCLGCWEALWANF